MMLPEWCLPRSQLKLANLPNFVPKQCQSQVKSITQCKTEKSVTFCTPKLNFIAFESRKKHYSSESPFNSDFCMSLCMLPIEIFSYLLQCSTVQLWVILSLSFHSEILSGDFIAAANPFLSDIFYPLRKPIATYDIANGPRLPPFE